MHMVTHADCAIAGCTADMLRLHFHDNQGLVITYQGSSFKLRLDTQTQTERHTQSQAPARAGSPRTPQGTWAMAGLSSTAWMRRWLC